MLKLGVAVSDLGPSQLNHYFIHTANAWLAEDPRNSVVAFYENVARSAVQPNFAIMQFAELWCFDGCAIATNLNTASKLLRLPGPKLKVFYCYDLEWIRLQAKSFDALSEIYRNPELKLIARCEEHAKLISRCWNAEVVGTMEELDVRELAQLITKLEGQVVT